MNVKIYSCSFRTQSEMFDIGHPGINHGTSWPRTQDNPKIITSYTDGKLLIKNTEGGGFGAFWTNRNISSSDTCYLEMLVTFSNEGTWPSFDFGLGTANAGIWCSNNDRNDTNSRLRGIGWNQDGSAINNGETNLGSISIYDMDNNEIQTSQLTCGNKYRIIFDCASLLNGLTETCTEFFIIPYHCSLTIDYITLRTNAYQFGY